MNREPFPREISADIQQELIYLESLTSEDSSVNAEDPMRQAWLHFGTIMGKVQAQVQDISEISVNKQLELEKTRKISPQVRFYKYIVYAAAAVIMILIISVSVRQGDPSGSAPELVVTNEDMVDLAWESSVDEEILDLDSQISSFSDNWSQLDMELAAISYDLDVLLSDDYF